jgi:3-hydroxyisobutyrate dehydrogenase
MVNQICIAGLLQGLSEGMNFGLKAGPGHAEGNRLHLQGRGGLLADGKPRQYDVPRRVRFRLRRGLDAQGSRDLPRGGSKNNGARFPVTAMVDQFYTQVQARGGNRWDTSSLIHLLAND